MTMLCDEDLLGMLRPLFRLAQATLPADDFKQLLLKWTAPVKAKGKVAENVRDGSLCVVRSSTCFLPGERLACGEEVSLQVLPAPAGLPFTSWAEVREPQEEGWSPVARRIRRGARVPNETPRTEGATNSRAAKPPPGTSSLHEANGRGRCANAGAAPGR